MGGRDRRTSSRSVRLRPTRRGSQPPDDVRDARERADVHQHRPDERPERRAATSVAGLLRRQPDCRQPDGRTAPRCRGRPVKPASGFGLGSTSECGRGAPFGRRSIELKKFCWLQRLRGQAGSSPVSGLGPARRPWAPGVRRSARATRPPTRRPPPGLRVAPEGRRGWVAPRRCSPKEPTVPGCPGGLSRSHESVGIR
jgi:hypothetical protein